MREMRETLAKRLAGNGTPVLAVIGAGATQDRSIAALNIALAAARDGTKVLLIDADHAAHALSDKMAGFSKPEVNHLSWLSGTKASRAIKTANGITILPVIKAAGTGDAVREAVTQAHSAGGYDLVIFDGPAMPCSDAERALLDVADGLAAILPANLDINECMDGIIVALGDTERKLIGVIIDELHPTTSVRQRSKQYA